jgi:hypothetical protein
MLKAIKPMPDSNQTDATFSICKNLAYQEWTLAVLFLLRVVSLSRWCAVVVERTLEKQLQFEGVGARAI